jgi:hypothetical protein
LASQVARFNAPSLGRVVDPRYVAMMGVDLCA